MPKATISANNTAGGGQVGQTGQPKKRGCLGTALIVLLWICFFPIMFTIWAVRTPRFEKKVKIPLIAAVWILFLVVAGCTSMTNDQLAKDRTLDFNAIEITDGKAVVKATATNSTSSSWSSTAYLVVHYTDGDEEKLSIRISCDKEASAELTSPSFSPDNVSSFETDYTGAQVTYSAGELTSLLTAEQERVAAEEAQKKAEEEAAAQKKTEEEAAAAAAAEAEAQQKAEEEAAAAAEAQAQAEADAAAKAQAQEEARNNQTVYVTATGSKYHSRKGCSGLNNANSVSETTRGQAEARGLEPCKKCC